jgi:hypothetical protein
VQPVHADGDFVARDRMLAFARRYVRR